ncbi:hypothetical protein SDC9_189631 [bioreactor metagenome]|uniref:Uncharacterized protein n=1 Tax=bioreactor metagenome TaxID=1076179 RepID=A0A645HSQ0_9ZZZZ
MKIQFVALVLHFGKTLDDLPLSHAIADPHGQDHLVVLVPVADAVDARHRRDDHAVPSFKQALGRGEPHLLDVLVNRRILLDEQVARRNVGLGLVIVVIGNEVLDRIFRQEFAKLGIQLCRQRLVRRQHQRRPAGTGDHVGHRIRFA